MRGLLRRLRRRARARAADGRARAADVVYVESTYVPGDQTVLHLFDAPSAAALEEAGSTCRAAVRANRGGGQRKEFEMRFQRSWCWVRRKYGAATRRASRRRDLRVGATAAGQAGPGVQKVAGNGVATVGRRPGQFWANANGSRRSTRRATSTPRTRTTTVSRCSRRPARSRRQHAAVETSLTVPDVATGPGGVGLGDDGHQARRVVQLRRRRRALTTREVRRSAIAIDASRERLRVDGRRQHQGAR